MLFHTLTFFTKRELGKGNLKKPRKKGGKTEESQELKR